MALATGTHLGPYEILSALGAGGMGEVYRARDARLDRIVAIKVLKEQFSERFQREAKAVAALNHPHICQLYDVGPNYLVMEFVDGTPLKGPLPLDRAVEYAGQILDALDAAHRRGIVHRDLKPANILRTAQGIKLLDFGLAKQTALRGEFDATRTALTSKGQILGTLPYISPEQLQGKEEDARSDLFSFGCVLYEMLTGSRAFQGQSPASVMASILERDPVPLNVTPPLERVIKTCLAKDPDQRFQTAIDLKRNLSWAMEQSTAAEPSRRWWFVAAAGLLLGVFGGMASWGWLRALTGEPHPVARWTATLPVPDPLAGFGLSVSRDGTRLAYAEQWEGLSRIWVRMLDQPEGKPIRGTEGGLRPFFSPDGRWLAYFTGQAGALRKVPVTGGTPITLCEEAFFWGGSWGEDDRLIFSGRSGGLMRVSASGGACEVLTTADWKREEIHDWPQVLPGGQAVLFTIGRLRSFDSARIAVLELKTGHYRVVVNGGSSARYVPSGHLVYVRGGIMFAVPFDLKRLAVTGPETPAIEGVYYNSAAGFADYTFSASGLLVYRAETLSTNLRTLEWLDRKGTSQVSPAPPQDYESVRLSPDGQRAAVLVRRVGYDIWILELVRGALTRLTTEGMYTLHPVWTPDGRRVVFGYGPDGSLGLHWAAADGSGKPERLLAGQGGIPDSWTPDGKTLLYESAGPAHIWTLQPAGSGGDGKPRPLFEATSFNEGDAQVSPDGRWIAYTSDESGKNRVYLRPLAGPGGKTPVSIEGGQEPRWSRDGRELFYRDAGKNQLMAADIQTSSALRAGRPHALVTLGNVPWDVAPDGKRFLVVKEPETPDREAKLRVVVNWFEELRQRAPTGKK